MAWFCADKENNNAVLVCKNLSVHTYLTAVERATEALGLKHKRLYIVTQKTLDKFMRGRANFKVFTDNSIYC